MKGQDGRKVNRRVAPLISIEVNALYHLLSWKGISIIIIILFANDCGIGKIVYICTLKRGLQQ